VSHYDTLGVDRSATKEEIKKAFRAKALEHHPDRNLGDLGAEQRFKDVNEAFQVLNDDAKRYTYDLIHGTSPRSTARGSRYGSSFSTASVEDLMDILFRAQRARRAPPDFNFEQWQAHHEHTWQATDRREADDEAAGAYEKHEQSRRARYAETEQRIEKFSMEGKRPPTSKGRIGRCLYYEWRVSRKVVKTAVRLMGPSPEEPRTVGVETVVGPGGTATIFCDRLELPEDLEFGWQLNSKTKGWKHTLGGLIRKQMRALLDSPKCPECRAPMYKGDTFKHPDIDHDGEIWICVRSSLYTCQGAREETGEPIQLDT